MTFTDIEKEIINRQSSFKQIRLEFPDHEIEDIGNSQVALDAMSLEESLCESDNLTFGKCNGSIFKIRVADFTENIENARMNVYVKFTNEELGEVDVPFGKYIISQPPERTSDRRWRDITATDYMTLFDVDIAEWYNNTLYPTSETTRTVKYIRTELCKYIDVKCEDTTLINDDLIISKTIEPTSLSGRDLLQNICEINACFGHFDWDGILKFITLDFSGLYPSENLFPSKNLYPRGKSADSEYILSYKQDKCNYEDYDVKEINTVAITKEEGGLAVVYRQPQVTAEEEVENRYTITGNILLYEHDETVLENVAKKICDKVCGCSYRPNDVEVFGGIYMHLGQSYTVHSTFIVGSDIIENPYESYVLKRTIKGIQAMSQVLEAKGEQYQPETQDHDIMTQLSVLKGRSAKYKRDFDELVVEYKDFEQGTSSHFSITDQAIEAEVTRATQAEGNLSSRITQNADSITSEVNRAKQAENGIKEDYGSKFEQTAESITAELTRATNAENGLSDNISNVNSTLSSKIEQTAESITSTVASATTKYDESKYVITYKGYGDAESVYPYDNTKYNGKYYLDLTTGNIWYGGIPADYPYVPGMPIKWYKVDTLALITEELSSRIEQTLKTITLAVEDNGTEAGIYITTEKEDGTKSSKTKVGTIELKGLVRFTNLSTSGETTINGANIKTGTINADLIKAGHINCDLLNGGTIDGQTISGGVISGADITTSGSLKMRNALGDTNVMYVDYEGTVSPVCLTINGSGFGAGVKLYGNLHLPYCSIILDTRGTSGIYSPNILNYLVREYLSGGSTWVNAFGNTAQPTVLYGSTCYINGTSTVITSDGRYKEDIREVDRYEDVFFSLKPVAFKVKDGESGRHHIGFIAQDVKDAINKNGLSTQDFAGYVEYDTDKDLYPYIDDDKMCGLRYDEFIALNTHMIQKQHKEIETLKEENKTIKDELATLQKQVAFLMSKIGE